VDKRTRISADIGVIESRLEGLEARLRALERRDQR
jgi:hypothetical protein